MTTLPDRPDQPVATQPAAALIRSTTRSTRP